MDKLTPKINMELAIWFDQETKGRENGFHVDMVVPEADLSLSIHEFNQKYLIPALHCLLGRFEDPNFGEKLLKAACRGYIAEPERSLAHYHAVRKASLNG